MTETCSTPYRLVSMAACHQVAAHNRMYARTYAKYLSFCQLQIREEHKHTSVHLLAHMLVCQSHLSM